MPDDIMDHILDVEMDRDYYQSILEGTWPTAKERLTEALEKITSENQHEEVFNDIIGKELL